MGFFTLFGDRSTRGDTRIGSVQTGDVLKTGDILSPRGTLIRTGDKESAFLRVERHGLRVCEGCGEEIRECECDRGSSSGRPAWGGDRRPALERGTGEGRTAGGFPDGSGAEWGGR